MPLFSTYFHFSCELVVFKPRRTATTMERNIIKSKSNWASASRPCTPSQQSAEVDTSERSLSPFAQKLQRRARESVRGKQAIRADAHSLRLLETAKKKSRRRERLFDAQSLEVLLQSTAEAESERSSSRGGSTGRSCWSFFEDLEGETPCPSPRPSPRPGASAEDDVRECSDALRSEITFEQSMLEEGRRRDVSWIIERAGQSGYQQGQQECCGADEAIRGARGDG